MTAAGDDADGEAMNFPGMVQVHAGYVPGAGSLIAWDEVPHFAELSHD